MKFIYLLILIIILLIILTNYNDILKIDVYEHYDGVVRNINTIEDCADITSSIYDTSAFSYDPSNNNCYISKTSLTRPPIQIHPYHNDFKISDVICNKRLYAKNSELNFDNIFIGNRLYECYKNDSKIKDDIDTFYFQKDKQKQLITYQDTSKLPITKHNFFNIDWPINKDELNDIKVIMRKIKAESEQKSKQERKQESKQESETKTIIDSIDWKPKIERKEEEIKLNYGYEYKYPQLGCIN